MKKNRRKKVVVDNEIQHGLARRLVTYWGVTWLLVFSLPIVMRMLTERIPFDQLATQIITDFWFPIVISVLLIPIVVWDSLRFSHRVAGPISRIKKTVESISGGDKVRPIKLRKNDFCGPLADEVNKLIDSTASSSDERNETLETVA